MKPIENSTILCWFLPFFGMRIGERTQEVPIGKSPNAQIKSPEILFQGFLYSCLD